MESWRPIPGYDSLYEVSSLGRVRSLDRRDPAGRSRRGRLLKLKNDKNGYQSVSLSKEGVVRQLLVHRLVLFAFSGRPAPGQETLHADGDRSNNSIANLSWGTRAQNHEDMARHGTHRNARKTACPRGHLLQGENLVKSKAGRVCLACTREGARARHSGRAFSNAGADDSYRRIMSLGASAGRESCKWGHLLTSWNTEGGSRRRCKSCSLARTLAFDKGIPFDRTVADEAFLKYQKKYLNDEFVVI